MDLENAKAQMRKGVLELCILAIIEGDEVYPSDIIARLKANDLIVVEGTRLDDQIVAAAGVAGRLHAQLHGSCKLSALPSSGASTMDEQP